MTTSRNNAIYSTTAVSVSKAYQLSGIVQKFPNHFHECYVVGFIEGGAAICGAADPSTICRKEI